MRARAPAVKGRQRLLVLALVMLGLAPIACLSDVTVRECVDRGDCNASGRSGMGGWAGSLAEAGVGGAAEPEGEAGTVGQPVGVGGEPEPGGSSNAGDGGMGGAGTGGAGTGGAEALACGCSLNPPALPAPCGTSPYLTKLQFVGGTAPYTWELTPAIEGWELSPTAADSSYALLTSVHPGASEVTVTVTDAAGKPVTTSYSVTPRTACWFAFTALSAVDGPKLNLVDPILDATTPVAFANNHDVYDFAFSPNGTYLAYRFGADADHPKGRHLAVVNLSTWAEQQLVLSDDTSSAGLVTAFAWSPDSSTLAASFVHEEQQYLGGIRFAADGQLSKLTPLQTPVDSELHWLGANYVVFFANGSFDPEQPDQLAPDDGFVTAFYSRLGAVGFEHPTRSTEASYELPIFVQIASNGFYVNTPSYDYLQFNWLHPAPSAIDHTRRIVSPSGRFTADPPNGSLKLYRAESRNPILTDAQSPDRDCPKLLTWARGKERMACARDIPPNVQGMKHSELRIFEIDDANTLTVAPVEGYCLKDAQSASTTDPCAQKEYDYSVADANLEPRIFSHLGEWLAFSPSSAGGKISYLYLADLRTKPFQIAVKVAHVTLTSDGSSPKKLSFSPNDSLLLRQRGRSLIAYSVSVQSSAAPLLDFDAEMPDSTPNCSEDYASAPNRWCGNADRDARFKWSPSSKFAAYRSRGPGNAETISTVDFTRFPAFDTHQFQATACGSKCSGQFAFQP